jgi:hypothetical protein
LGVDVAIVSVVQVVHDDDDARDEHQIKEQLQQSGASSA